MRVGEGEGATMAERTVVLSEGNLPDAVEQGLISMKKGSSLMTGKVDMFGAFVMWLGHYCM